MESKRCTMCNIENFNNFNKTCSECIVCNYKRVLKRYHDNKDKKSNQQKIYF